MIKTGIHISLCFSNFLGLVECCRKNCNCYQNGNLHTTAINKSDNHMILNTLVLAKSSCQIKSIILDGKLILFKSKGKINMVTIINGGIFHLQYCTI